MNPDELIAQFNHLYLYEQPTRWLFYNSQLDQLLIYKKFTWFGRPHKKNQEMVQSIKEKLHKYEKIFDKESKH